MVDEICAMFAQSAGYMRSSIIVALRELGIRGIKIVSGGTDNHLFLLDFSDREITGKMVQDALDEVGITLNKNCVPNEKRSPQQTSGVRIGTAAMTTRGFTKEDFIETAHKIFRRFLILCISSICDSLFFRLSHTEALFFKRKHNDNANAYLERNICRVHLYISRDDVRFS